jgi:hypothetical protein
MLVLGPMPGPVRQAVRRLIAETRPSGRREHDERLCGLLLSGGPTGCFYLDAEGEVWDCSTWDDSIEVVPEGELKVGIVADAADRIPELAMWLPARPSDAPSCQHCQESGRMPPPLEFLQCPGCFGLGWRSD